MVAVFLTSAAEISNSIAVRRDLVQERTSRVRGSEEILPNVVIQIFLLS